MSDIYRNNIGRASAKVSVRPVPVDTPATITAVPRITTTARNALDKAYHDVIRYLTAQLGKADETDEQKKDRASRLADSLPLLALGQVITPDEMTGVAEAAAKQYLAQLSIPDADIFGQVNERAVTYAKDRAAELVSGLDEVTRDELRQVIADSLLDNEGLAALTQKIKGAYAFSDERAELIARTEVAMANQHGALAGMRLARQSGLDVHKLWLPDALACDVCIENGEDGPIDLDELFSSSDLAPPGHPNCRCTLASEIEDK